MSSPPFPHLEIHTSDSHPLQTTESDFYEMVVINGSRKNIIEGLL